LVLVIDPNRVLRHASRKWNDLFDEPADDVVGRPLLDVIRSETLVPNDRRAFAQRLESALRHGATVRIPLRHCDSKLGWRQLEGRAYQNDDETLIVFHDVTDREQETADTLASEGRAHEERSLRVAKLESLGVLTAGVAHDFNNLLTPILGNASLLLTDLPENAPGRRWAEAIRGAAERATGLTTRMLAYAGRTEQEISLLDVSDVVRDLKLLLETTASRSSRLHYSLAPGLPRVHGDAAQITQIVVNLVANASEALGDEGGRIDVRTGRLRADRASLDACHLGETLSEGEYVFIDVCDGANGLAEVDRERILDPFFSTKSTGRGLGLSVVIGVMRAHGGALDIRCGPQDGDARPEAGGTCFRALFPAVARAS
jgi:signal transduction histidine kinase